MQSYPAGGLVLSLSHNLLKNMCSVKHKFAQLDFFLNEGLVGVFESISVCSWIF